MAGLIGIGQKIKEEAKGGLLNLAREEAANKVVEDQMAQMKAAQETQMIGTAAGIGAAYGASTATATGMSAKLAAAGPYALMAAAAGWLLNKLFD